MDQATVQQTPSSVKVDEHILVIKRDLLFANGAWQGIRSEDVNRYQAMVTTSGEFHWRSAMENDLTYKQIIPYMIFEFENSYFLMERKATASEQRLKSKLSLGIGGHIRQEDIAGGTIFDWAKREFNEEVSYHGALDIEPLGVLNDDSDAVGQVHLGLILLLHGNSSEITIRSEHKQGSLVADSCLDSYVDRMESWSKIAWHHMRHSL
jgi:predicted NUDIX family phosphoesterase